MRSWLAAARPGDAGRHEGGISLTDRGTPAPRRPGDSEAVAASGSLGPREQLVLALRGIGSTMLLTNARILVARDGLERRPRSGVQTFPLQGIDRIGIEGGMGSGRRMVIWTGPLEEGASMFLSPATLDRAEAFVAEARPRIARCRRGIPDPDPDGARRARR